MKIIDCYKITVFFILLNAVLLQKLKAQDPQFTQFYAAPLYLNPALSGSTKLTKAAFLYRNQWPSIPANFVTYSASIDQSLPRFSSGVGLSVVKDQLGEAFSTTTVTANYSFYFNLTKKVEVRMGTGIGYGIRRIDLSKITFETGASSTESITSPNNSYIDISGGLELHNSVYSLGFSAFHLNKPTNSFLNSNEVLPIRFNLHAGARLPLKLKVLRPLYRLLYSVVKKELFINPKLLLKKQGAFTQLDLGLDVHYGIFMFGIWNRGLPLGTSSRVNGFSRESIALLAGYSQHGLTAAYSYDFTISQQSISTGGAHELSLVYLFDLKIDRKKPLRRHQIIPCPQF
ncbi:MAG: PorP/SprF family type IX secretion system membrane protein [Cyclobacteriaceae bacterium]